MSDPKFSVTNCRKTLFSTLLNISKNSYNKIIVSDSTDRKLTYNKLITASIFFSKKIKQIANKNQPIGILLPNMAITVIIFFAIQFLKQLPAMLNFTIGLEGLIKCCKLAQIKVIITSKKFIHSAQLETLISQLEQHQIQIYYLEDIYNSISLISKIKAWLQAKIIRYFYYDSQSPNKAAVILFTSGSEAAPKAVALSHLNIISNINQLASTIDLKPSDKLFNVLPIFHSFGLTAGTLLPLLCRIEAFLYPSPLHYKIIPELIFKVQPTIFFGTDTFLSNYAKYTEPKYFQTVRYIFAGAEKLKNETYQLWLEKFNIKIFEGYGVTETAPVIAVNTPSHHKIGTVGKILPGMQYKIKKVPNIKQGGILLVKGPNVMLGYLSNNKIIPLKNNYHNTGDIVKIDHEKFITIIGRIKRFAKIGGEMVSLTTVETYITKLWPHHLHAIINIAHPKKGEELILLTNYEHAKTSEVAKYFHDNSIAKIYMPKKILITKEMPIFATGKIDYISAEKLVLALL
jgi:acyl-[acyl-carrier-protein]-phospholipid O-acyltransferase/long-chain-fatty-acid--[acyl-carrier-protein] ligase